MKNVDVIYIKRYFDKLTHLCDLLDEKELWNRPDFGNVTLKSIFRHNLAEFLMYLSSSDGVITAEEAAMYNEVTGFQGDIERMVAYINENDIYSARFETEVPLIFRLIKECEKTSNETGKYIDINLNRSFSGLFADFFAIIADVFIEVDGEIAFPEMEDSNIYLSTIKKYISKGTKSIDDYYAMIDALEIN